MTSRVDRMDGRRGLAPRPRPTRRPITERSGWWAGARDVLAAALALGCLVAWGGVLALIGG